MKKIVSVLLSMLICFMAVPLHMVSFADDYCPFSRGGTGTEKDPYKISTAYDLKILAELINDSDNVDYNFAYYIQTNDIDLNDENFTPIGIYFNNGGTNLTENSVFCGHYNGNYHSVYNLNVDYDNRYTGLFGRIGGGEASKKTNCEVENLSVYGSIKSNVNNDPVIGGIAGEIGYGAIVRNCNFTGNLSGAGYVGGITGFICAGGEITSCYSNVSINSSKYAGGIVSTVHIGKNELSKDAKIKNCYTLGNIESENKKGGIFSNLIDDEVIKNTLTIENNYYIDTIADNGFITQGCNKLSSSFMKNVNEFLGEPFVCNDNEELNDGYPVFEWQSTPYRFKGSGTADDPYQISSKEELEKMRDLVNSMYFNPIYGLAYYIQITDIDLKSENWTPIGIFLVNGSGTEKATFRGNYNGNGKNIYNLKINSDLNYRGLFGQLRGGFIDDCCVKNLAVNGMIESSKNNYIGGICGELSYNSYISNCSFNGSVVGNNYVGGICGKVWQGANIISCYHNGTVTGNSCVCGILGNISDDSLDVAIENCYHVGKITSKDEYAGAIVGKSVVNTEKNSKVSISNSYYINSDASSPINGTYTSLNCLALTPSLLKLIAEDLGEGFIKNPDNSFNNGYPVFTWQIKANGDVNDDGNINSADAVMLQKWILGSGQLINYKNADLYKDGIIDVFDLVILKQLIAKG